jgi:pimeloyl-ACP methyl ester carboxylesterase
MAARFPRIVAVSGWAEPRAFFRVAGARSKESRAGATRIPKVTNGFAAERDVILVDNAGVGGSTGETPSTVAAMTKDCVDFCRALDLKSFDVVGFSLRGTIAQQLAFEYPDLIWRMILLGTGPRGGEGMTFTELSPDELADPVALLQGRR